MGWPTGMTPWNKGLTKETDGRLRLSAMKSSSSHSGKKLSDEHKSAIGVGNVGRIVSSKTRSRISRSSIGHVPWNRGSTKCDDVRIAEASCVLVKRWKDPEYRGKQVDAAIQRWKDPIQRKNASECGKKRFQDPMYAKRILHRRTPSSPEQTFIDMCKEFQYVGDGTLVIDGKNPDFVCINDEHKLVEIWGNYFHKGQDPQDRINFFKDRGYDCLIIWASELKSIDSVMTRVNKFVNAS